MYVLSSIDITIMMDATFRACPVTNIKCKGVEKMPTVKASFGGWVPFVDLDKVTSIPLRFVF
jgi:hypothetical protein